MIMNQKTLFKLLINKAKFKTKYFITVNLTQYNNEIADWLSNISDFCANPGTPQNGRRLGSDFRHGMTVTFLCLHGFTPSGVSRITCNDGTWSNKIPVCTGNGDVRSRK